MAPFLSKLAEHAALNLPHTADRLRGLYEVLTHLDLRSPAVYTAFLSLLPYTWFFFAYVFVDRHERQRLRDRPDPIMAYILWSEERLMQAWRLHFVTQLLWIVPALFDQSGENGSWELVLLDLLLEDVIIEVCHLLTMLTVAVVVLWFLLKYELRGWV